MPWDRLWDAFFNMPGIHPAFFLLTLWVLWSVVKELRTSEAARLVEHKDCAKASNDIAEKRIEEQRATLQILDRNAVNMAARTAALDGTVVAAQEQTKGFEKLTLAVELRARADEERNKITEKQLDNLIRAIADKR